MHYSQHRSHRSHRRGNHFVARTNIECAQAELDSLHSVSYTDAKICSAKFRPALLKTFNLFAENECARRKDPLDRRALGLSQLLWLRREIVHPDHDEEFQ